MKLAVHWAPSVWVMTPGWTVAEEAGAQSAAGGAEAPTSVAAATSPAIRVLRMGPVTQVMVKTCGEGERVPSARVARLDRSHELAARARHAAGHRGAAPARRRGARHRARLRADAGAARALPARSHGDRPP